ncbi:Eco57I restriction-modification methylase domain-containing protein [Kribbella caucasensis]|uniref:Eco57I restriction-modification methylase domain-containing protein n=1 Tax=Kribbella caucasensis TaxID=2512215 RepID=UPI00192D2ED2|nr:DNA methyltransferase [Kribbella sp. VKM Ac-2527]
MTPSFVLPIPGEEPKPDNTRLLGMIVDSGQHPTARISGSEWAATPVDRVALLCRRHGVELGLVTDGRWWALVYAPKGKATGYAVFDAVAWPEAAERVVVRAFSSLLRRQRFFGVPDDETLVSLLHGSEAAGEEITERLGVQVRQAVELLVAAIGRSDLQARERDEPGLSGVSAHDVYRGAVSVMMRIVFLLFAEERKLLPSDNDLYANSYSAGRLCAELEERALQGSEDELANTYGAWHRLLALFSAVYHGFEHPRLVMHGHDGSLFNPDEYPWLPYTIDDRTVLHMLRAVQYVEIGTGRSRERRALSFRSLDVEQIGYVYEGLLSFDAYHADDLVVGLVGKEGLEDEVRLRDLESLAGTASDVPWLAAVLAEHYKDSKIGSAAALTKRLAPLDGVDREEARKRLLAVVGGDYPLAERLLPFYGVIRHDLRGLPVVVLSGALYVTESSLRKTTGTHYTPRELAEKVVEGALEPLVFSPGPLDTSDTKQWKPKSSAEILSLKVADIAMGSAAFLVAAARYLGAHLVDAWSREGDPRAGEYVARGNDGGGDADEDPLVIEARRQVIEHCLYGVDINPMAVEMAKLSLWLVSMDPERPFTFLDDRLVAGDSLLGITSLDQLEYMHLNPASGRKLHEGAVLDWTAGVRSLVGEAAAERRKLTEIDATGPDPLAALNAKRTILEDIKLRTGQLRLFADLLVGASLANAKRGAAGFDAASGASSELAAKVSSGTAEPDAHEQRRHWLATDQVDGGFDRSPVHWPLDFPEVFENGGFDAIIGNPPFLGGQKLTGAMGTTYREYLVQHVGRGARGSADLIAYFVLRAQDVLNTAGQTGLIATNTLAQGATREVGLDQIVADGVAIRQAIKSEQWPSRSAVLEYCAVWTSKEVLAADAARSVDGVAALRITPSLDPGSRAQGTPRRLVANSGRSFQGSIILGLGFTLEPDEARQLIEQDPRNDKVLFQYLNGQDLNSRPDCSASRWVINFREWSEDEARTYPRCFERVQRLVKPERDAQKDRGGRQFWWRYLRPRPELSAAIAGLERVLVLAQVSRTVMPAFVSNGLVFDQKLVVFAASDAEMLALLTSSIHYSWAARYSATMKADLSYSPSDVFQTFALPELTAELRGLGGDLDTYRRDVMLSRQLGLTKLYNLVFDESVRDPEIDELRRIHREIDVATVRAYGWDDLLDQGLDHGFHQAGAYVRYTIGPAVRQEILDRLLELNHARYAEEMAAGLHDKRKPKKARAAKAAPGTEQDGLF